MKTSWAFMMFRYVPEASLLQSNIHVVLSCTHSNMQGSHDDDVIKTCWH